MSPSPELAVRELETDLVVTRREVAAQDVVALTLEHPDGRKLPGWTPGAHIDVGPGAIARAAVLAVLEPG